MIFWIVALYCRRCVVAVLGDNNEKRERREIIIEVATVLVESKINR
jgi:hypothetical protein